MDLTERIPIKRPEYIEVGGVEYKRARFTPPDVIYTYYVSKEGTVVSRDNNGCIEEVEPHFHVNAYSVNLAISNPRFRAGVFLPYLVYETWERKLKKNETIEYKDGNPKNVSLDNLVAKKFSISD